jgi:ubiquinone/menaquinone biosynthesis C-methylase UbiE
MKDRKILLRNEADFHDKWALGTDLGDVNVHASFESPTAFDQRFALEQLQPLEGKRILDVGSGLGESATYFALQGAKVTAADISPEQIELAKRVAQHHGTSIEGVVCSGDSLNLEDDSFDLVYAANVYHHVADRETFLKEMQRVLVSGGTCVFLDPLAYNPIINIYRRIATEVRTEDESPLKKEDIQRFTEYFHDAKHREFWLLAQLLFVKYFIFDRVHPNEDRYWKRILKEKDKDLWWWKPLRDIDNILLNIPLVNYFAWNTVLWGTKA